MAKGFGRMTRREKITLSAVSATPLTAKELKVEQADLVRLVQRGLISTFEFEGKDTFYVPEDDQAETVEGET